MSTFMKTIYITDIPTPTRKALDIHDIMCFISHLHYILPALTSGILFTRAYAHMH